MTQASETPLSTLDRVQVEKTLLSELGVELKKLCPHCGRLMIIAPRKAQTLDAVTDKLLGGQKIVHITLSEHKTCKQKSHFKITALADGTLNITLTDAITVGPEDEWFDSSPTTTDPGSKSPEGLGTEGGGGDEDEKELDTGDVKLVDEGDKETKKLGDVATSSLHLYGDEIKPAGPTEAHGPGEEHVNDARATRPTIIAAVVNEYFTHDASASSARGGRTIMAHVVPVAPPAPPPSANAAPLPPPMSAPLPNTLPNTAALDAAGLSPQAAILQTPTAIHAAVPESPPNYFPKPKLEELPTVILPSLMEPARPRPRRFGRAIGTVAMIVGGIATFVTTSLLLKEENPRKERALEANVPAAMKLPPKLLRQRPVIFEAHPEFSTTGNGVRRLSSINPQVRGTDGVAEDFSSGWQSVEIIRDGEKVRVIQLNVAERTREAFACTFEVPGRILKIPNKKEEGKGFGPKEFPCEEEVR